MLHWNKETTPQNQLKGKGNQSNTTVKLSVSRRNKSRRPGNQNNTTGNEVSRDTMTGRNRKSNYLSWDGVSVNAINPNDQEIRDTIRPKDVSAGTAMNRKEKEAKAKLQWNEMSVDTDVLRTRNFKRKIRYSEMKWRLTQWIERTNES